MVGTRQQHVVIQQEKKDDKMNIEYFRQKQMQLEKQFKKINMHIVAYTTSTGIITLSVGIMIIYTEYEMDIFTSKNIPILCNPVLLLFIAGCIIIIAFLDNKKIIGKEGI